MEFNQRYRITITGPEGESRQVTAVTPKCGFGWVVPFDDLHAFARQSGCSHGL